MCNVPAMFMYPSEPCVMHTPATFDVYVIYDVYMCAGNCNAWLVVGLADGVPKVQFCSSALPLFLTGGC